MGLGILGDYGASMGLLRGCLIAKVIMKWNQNLVKALSSSACPLVITYGASEENLLRCNGMVRFLSDSVFFPLFSSASNILLTDSRVHE
jgi:hypothetical protein